MKSLASLMFLALFSQGISAAELRLGSLLCDNAVIQRDQPIPIWGSAPAGATLTVILGTKTLPAQADKDEHWLVTFPPISASVEPLELTVKCRGNSIKCQNIVIGEVWLASGQSNMSDQCPLSSNRDSTEECEKADFPHFRQFAIGPDWNGAAEPKPFLNGSPSWTICTPKTARSFAACAYFFGRDLHRELKVPVGIIRSAVAGSSIDQWYGPMDPQDPNVKSLHDLYQEALNAYPENMKKHELKLATWEQDCESAKAAGRTLPAKPAEPTKPHFGLGKYYNSMIAPLQPAAIRGVIWWQGEANTTIGSGALYADQFAGLIKSWRSAWNRGDFPFLFVQLQNLGQSRTPVEVSGYAEIREAQAKALSLPKTGMAVAIDCDGGLLPTDKDKPGTRLALLALKNTYGKEVIAWSPMFDKAKIDGNRILVTMKNVGSGLIAKIKGNGEGKTVTGFAIAGEDRNWEAAEAQITEAGIVVISPKVPKPIAVRYAWSTGPEANLYNKEGLPAAPFRSDSWVLVEKK
jgi:sialate O-acetylesterase